MSVQLWQETSANEALLKETRLKCAVITRVGILIWQHPAK